MYLKSIRANGFKSFADKIEIDVDKGITGIVGPNGSGKSNVLDAIRWVMGEQSVKALRGDSSMTDVIFAGSKSRGASTRAWVSLTFDNTDHYLNSEFNEIELKRIVYKTGENEYYINNSKVRLKDITDLFLDSGAGKESFNIISQGAVADIINSKPEDRRIIFEEAAGVLKYKKRKDESYRKLDKTNENLARVNLLIDELLTTLEPLKEQSEKAKKFLDYKEELENIEVALIVHDIDKINEDYETVKNNVARLNREIEELETLNTTDTSKVEQLKLVSLKLDQDIEEKSAVLLSIAREVADLQSKKQIETERQKYNVEDGKLEQNIISLKEEVMRLSNHVSLFEKEIKEIKKEVETKQLLLMELSKSGSEKKEKLDKTSSSLNDANKKKMILQNKIAILKENMQNDAKLPFAVKSIISNVRLEGICGVLGKLITVPDTYVTAVETALGANLNVVVVQNEKRAKEVISFLKENKLGRVTFFPLSVIKRRKVQEEDLNLLKGMEGFLGTLDSLVSYEDTYTEIVLNQMGNVLVVDNIDTLNRVGKLVNYKYKIVSLEGEILYTGGAITGGASKQNTNLLSQKLELENLEKELQEEDASIRHLEHDLAKLQEEVNFSRSKEETALRESLLLKEQLAVKESNYKEIENNYKVKKEELEGTENLVKESTQSALDQIMEEYYKKVQSQETEERNLAKLKKEKSDLVTQIAEAEKLYREQNYQMNIKQNELKQEEVKLGKMDVRLDNLLLSLNENYSMTYEKAKEEYDLDVHEGTARLSVNNLKAKIKELGDVNTGSIAEYERLSARHDFLTSQRNDLETSVSRLLGVIAEMDEIMKTRFTHVFEKIKEEFQVVFKKLFKGGEGVLELTHPDDILHTGIEISALPPGKKLNSIALLSGGEKTLTAIALLFAILNVKPVPFVVLDEVEAALDEVNVDAFGNYLLSRKERSQFILITHKKRTMEYADALYGITMQESGVSKLVSVKLEN